MGVRVIDPDDDSDLYTQSTCFACGSPAVTNADAHNSNKSRTKPSATTTTTTTTTNLHPPTTSTTTPPSFSAFEKFTSPSNPSPCGGKSYSESKTHTLNDNKNFRKTTKDLVGNSKEFRIEHNKCDLRIIGNSNRIRIGSNDGDVQIIGNNTRLKISNNSGHIKYTGNDGRICLGSDSNQQAIDYIGCNGILKVVNSMEMNLSGAKCSKQKSKSPTGRANEATTQSSSSATNAATTTQLPKSSPKKVKVKSASYGGGNCSSSAWEQFNELFQRQNWQHFANFSMPNLRENSSSNCKGSSSKGSSSKTNKQSKCLNINNNVSIVNNYGNVIIKNAVNVNI